MQQAATVILKARRALPFFGRHPWVFQGAIASVAGNPAPGQMVRVLSAEKTFIAYGLYNSNSNIRARLYSWNEDQPIEEAMIATRIEQAVRLRHELLGLADPNGACRLVFSESDGLSGLVVDRYADILVVVFSGLGMARFQETVVSTLTRLLAPRGIYRRTERGVGVQEGLELGDALLAGQVPEAPLVIRENGLEFLVDVRTGQKTGAFLDQRENRRALAQYCAGRSVLDVFCYGGGFGLTAARLGQAAAVLGIDAAASALALAEQNAQRNDVPAQFIGEDAVRAMQRLRREGRRFGVVVCDPPKYARTTGAVPRALKGYDRINQLALELLEPDGILLTCSCSGHVSSEQFVQMLAGAARKAGRELQVLQQRGQAADHPISIYCLETGYLKCLLARCVG